MIAQVEAMLGGRDSPIERLVHDYTLRESTIGSNEPAALGEWTTHDAEILMIVAANEIDMHLSGEIRYSGRTDGLSPAMLDAIEAVARRLGVPGIAVTLRQAAPVSELVATEWQTRMTASYRIGGRTPAPVNMLSDLPHWLRQRQRAERRNG
jgi:hypothetical protein